MQDRGLTNKGGVLLHNATELGFNASNLQCVLLRALPSSNLNLGLRHNTDSVFKESPWAHNMCRSIACPCEF